MTPVQLELFSDHRNYKYTIGQKKPKTKKKPPAVRFQENLNQIKNVLIELGVVGPIGIEINCRSYKHNRETALEVLKNLFSKVNYHITPDYLLQKGRGHISVCLPGEFFNFYIHFTDSKFTFVKQEKE